MVSPNWALLAAAALGALALALAVRVPLPERFARLAAAREAAAGLVRLPLLLAMSAVAAGAWLCECLAAYACARGLGVHLSLAETIVSFTVASLAGALSLLPGGLGVAETSMTALFQALGNVPRAAATALTVLVRLATLWFGVALGFAALALETRLGGRVGSAR